MDVETDNHSLNAGEQLLDAANYIKLIFKSQLKNPLDLKSINLMTFNARKLSILFQKTFPIEADKCLAIVNNTILLIGKSKTQMVFTTDKLLATLSLSRDNMYSYLQRVNQLDKPFSSFEKKVLQSIVRQSGIAIRTIPCLRVRNICK